MKKDLNRRQFLEKLALGSAAWALFPSLACAGKRRDGSSSRLPVIDEADICVLGGSCTGVFAAVRAARLGARVIVVERQNAFGGVATRALVNVWHSFLDAEFKNRIIAGLSQEVIERLARRNAVLEYKRSPSTGFRFNSQELMMELDELVLESGVRPYLHTLFSEPVTDGEGRLEGVVVDNKSGRGVIRAKYFIDATGDGDLCHRLGLPSYTHELMQPPTMCAHIEEYDAKEINRIIREHGEEFGIPSGFVWGGPLPGTKTFMLAARRVSGVDCSDAVQLTRAEMEGRRQVRAIMDMMRKYAGRELGLNGLPSCIGVRETRHFRCLHRLRVEDMLSGKRYDDAVANGRYRLDIHHQGKPGLTFRYLDGTEVYMRPGYPKQTGRWRPETGENPVFYQVPLRSLIPGRYDNLILAGRMLDTEMAAFSGVRVMVNMNQLGEAAGVASWLALDGSTSIARVDPGAVRKTLEKGGSIIL